MEGPRASRNDELSQVIKLINSVFRESENYPPTMEKEFPLLLCEDNIDNIRIMKDNGRPVSAVNYYSTDIMIYASKVRAASIGAVCTDPEYRGRSLATKILDDVEEKLRKENVDIMFISGTRSLYLNRGCCIVGGFYSLDLYPEKGMYNEIKIVNFNEKYISDMADIYSMEPVRYYRNLYEFEGFLKGSTTSWDGSEFRVFLIKKYESIVGYIVLKICKEEKNCGYVVEYAGDREAVYKAFYNIISDCSLDSLTFYMPIHDKIKSIAENDKKDLCSCSQCGSVKIINFESFMNKLKPYFAQYLKYKSTEVFKFSKESDAYIFNINNEELRIEDSNLLMQLIFGENKKDEGNSVLINMDDKPSIKEFMKTVFPLPFPWAGNMNFI